MLNRILHASIRAPHGIMLCSHESSRVCEAGGIRLTEQKLSCQGQHNPIEITSRWVEEEETTELYYMTLGIVLSQPV